MDKKKLKIARKKIDQIDKKIFNLIKKRTHVVKYILNLKTSKTHIIDHKRNKQILINIKKKSIKNKIDPYITIRIWKSMIWGYIKFQRKNFKKR